MPLALAVADDETMDMPEPEIADDSATQDAPEGEAPEAADDKPAPNAKLIAELEARLMVRFGELEEAQREEFAAVDRAKAAKRATEAAQTSVNATIFALRDARNGNGQPTLPFPETAPDPGATASVEVLKEHGLSEGRCEKLIEADLATVAAVEAAHRAGKLRDVKGIGDAANEQIEDSLLAWRENNPAPEDVTE